MQSIATVLLAHEDQFPARAQQAGRLADPRGRLAPDRRPVLGDGEIKGGVGQGDVLGARLDKLHPQTELRLATPRRVQLGRGYIHADDTPGAGPAQPGAEVAGAASQLDHVLPSSRGQSPQLIIGHVPYAPRDLGSRPNASCAPRRCTRRCWPSRHRG